MNEEQKDRFFDLLTTKAVYGLDDAEQRELEEFDKDLTEQELLSLERTAAAISMIGLEEEELPSHLWARIADDAGNHVVAKARTEKGYDNEAERNGSPWFAWLGWAIAVAACIALIVNIFVMRPETPEVAQVQPPVEVPKVKTPAELREEMLRSDGNMVRAEWAPGNVKDIGQVSGDVVWSDEKQAGYMRFRGLPPNDPSRQTYQLWIFDKTQDKATPIDGGTFDVAADGEVVKLE